MLSKYVMCTLSLVCATKQFIYMWSLFSPSLEWIDLLILQTLKSLPASASTDSCTMESPTVEEPVCDTPQMHGQLLYWFDTYFSAFAISFYVDARYLLYPFRGCFLSCGMPGCCHPVFVQAPSSNHRFFYNFLNGIHKLYYKFTMPYKVVF